MALYASHMYSMQLISSSSKAG